MDKVDETTIDSFRTYYLLVDYGDGKRCAWCEKLVKEIEKTEDLEKHLETHEKRDE